jgi:secondary thiamine-phosphate synthase enzyme
MPRRSSSFQLKTEGFGDVRDITGPVREFVSASKIAEGIAVVFVPGSTAGITTIEFESGAINDLKKAIERIAPQGIHYDHDARWGDGNGFAHVRAALLGPSLTIPVAQGRLLLGTWQQIVLIDFDNRPRTREIIVQAMGD